MAVTVFLTSGEGREVEADGARVEDGFFLVTRSYPDRQRVETVLTLWAGHVVGAHVEKDGVTEWVPGAGQVQQGSELARQLDGQDSREPRTPQGVVEATGARETGLSRIRGNCETNSRRISRVYRTR